MTLTIATCQFPTSAHIDVNLGCILKLLKRATKLRADVAHFPECCLSGYAGSDVESHQGTDWKLLQESLTQIKNAARSFKIWVVVGSAHQVQPQLKPHNSLFIIDHNGDPIDRYDKLFCAGDASEKTGDLAHYTPGTRFVVFDLKGVRCGAQICHDFRYPELYREYKKRGVQLMFHSFHSAHISPARFKFMRDQVGAENWSKNPAPTLPGITQPAAMQTAAADNYMWISCPNSSARISCWPSFFVRPDGVITGKLQRHKSGILISDVNPNTEYYDSTAAWRERAMEGIFHSGTAAESPN